MWWCGWLDRSLTPTAQFTFKAEASSGVSIILLKADPVDPVDPPMCAWISAGTIGSLGTQF